MRPIDADALFYKLVNTDPNTKGRFCDGVATAMSFVLNAPAIDAVPVVHGRWVKLGEADYKCSVCGFRFTSGDPIELFTHCRCGAKMDGGNDAENH